MTNDILKEYKNELVRCYKSIGVEADESVYVTGNISKLGRLRISKEMKLKGLHEAILKIIGPDGTIFSPAASMNLCNTKIPFSLKRTPSHQMGPLAEYFRLLEGSYRSMHPFWSICGSGRYAHHLNNVSKHAYGVGSPWSILLDLNSRQINFGLHPSKAVTLIHHIETIVGVPYRYNKEFLHPIDNGGKIVEEYFYQSVFYENSDIEKRIKLNEHFFEALKEKGMLNEVQLDSGLRIWSFLMKDFFDIAVSFFTDDIYTYLEKPPEKRPYAR